MFIVAYILWGVGAVLLVASVVAFFKLGVKDAWDFTKNRRVSNPSSGTGRIKPRKQKRDFTGSRKIPPKIKIASNADDSSTSTLNENSENSTDLLREDSESPTGILEEDSERPTGILVEESEKPTGILIEESEKPTGILIEDSEKPTGILEEKSEKPTDVLSEGSETPTDMLPKTPRKLKKDKIKPQVVKSHKKEDKSTFKFVLVKDEVVTHTDESID